MEALSRMNTFFCTSLASNETKRGRCFLIKAAYEDTIIIIQANISKDIPGAGAGKDEDTGPNTSPPLLSQGDTREGNLPGQCKFYGSPQSCFGVAHGSHPCQHRMWCNVHGACTSGRMATRLSAKQSVFPMSVTYCLSVPMPLPVLGY